MFECKNYRWYDAGLYAFVLYLFICISKALRYTSSADFSLSKNSWVRAFRKHIFFRRSLNPEVDVTYIFLFIYEEDEIAMKLTSFSKIVEKWILV